MQKISEAINQKSPALIEYATKAKVIPVISSFHNLKKRKAQHIYRESQLSPYDPWGDYLDMVIQFSYVCMFSIVWPLSALCALCNNILEIRGDASKMMRESRRAIPRRAHDIGRWRMALLIEAIVAVAVVSGFFVISTGQLEKWGNLFTNDTACPQAADPNSSTVIAEKMVPTMSCLPAPERVLVFLCFETAGLCCSYIA